ncbi:response regulator [Enterobacter asburiae]|uniref:response regulator n=1 Tax=Enterobacter asburiae TaxID=61645 RepID=UPI002FD33C8F
MTNRDFKLLIVEDEKELSDFISSCFSKVFRNIEITLASSRDSAFQILSARDVFFDLITLDLRIPSVNGGLDQDPQHGQGVLGKCLEVINGTPIVIITGTSTVDMIDGFLASSQRTDIWGCGSDKSTITHIRKENLECLPAKINEIYRDFEPIFNIEINANGFSLPIEHDRLMRIFTRKHNGRLVRLQQLGGGLSIAKVYSLEIKDITGNIILKAIAKCGPHRKIIEDSNNYDQSISRLPPEATPRKLGLLKFGGASCSAVFYGLADGYLHSFFKASESHLLNSAIRKSIQDILCNWYDKSHYSECKVKDIRNTLMSDADAEMVIGKFNISEAIVFEENTILCNKSLQHCDLHGENILINVECDNALLIDYGDIKENIRILDPITLECSYLFHPSSTRTSWPSSKNIECWDDLHSYIEECPFPDDIIFCREWTNSLKTGNREVSACLYSYALRQLKYEGTDKAIALQLINVAFKLYAQS